MLRGLTLFLPPFIIAAKHVKIMGKIEGNEEVHTVKFSKNRPKRKYNGIKFSTIY